MFFVFKSRNYFRSYFQIMIVSIRKGGKNRELWNFKGYKVWLDQVEFDTVLIKNSSISFTHISSSRFGGPTLRKCIECSAVFIPKLDSAHVQWNGIELLSMTRFHKIIYFFLIDLPFRMWGGFLESLFNPNWDKAGHFYPPCNFGI